MDTKAFFKLSYGLYIVTSKDHNHESGCVINTMTQVTSEPSQVCVTLNKENYTTQLIQKSGVLNVSVLLEKVSMDTIRQFGFQCGKDVNKFEGIDYEEDQNGVKYLTQESAAMFVCKVNKTVDVGTHLMFICEVQDTKVLEEGTVLTYAAYHEKKNGTTPKSAPSYVEVKDKTGWRCDVCGFIYEGETLPEGYICPICKVDASHFHKIENLS
ncbi:flavin reductase [Candidatus Stoquefichus massiliensis]|uniref:flavin reductase n=1 Tax=Candidatus Stoquefichus massiliensis TaxID=1470350 RepID=UPI0004831256|nr:flavin reductase [Candidatus Stoquefichus massiliensis]